MARRKHQPSKGRRRRAEAAATARKRAMNHATESCNDGANQTLTSVPLSPPPSPPSSLPHTQLMPDPSSMGGGTAGSKRPINGCDDPHRAVRFKKMRRRSPGPVGGCPTVLIPTAPLPLAVYQPASLFAMLLVASLLPKNAFSLRWLALSGGGIGDVIGQAGLGRSCMGRNGCKLFGERRNEASSSWLAMALDPESCMPCEEMADGEGAALEERKLLVALWRDVTSALEKTIGTALIEEEEGDTWSVESVLSAVPRGGDLGDKRYAGLVNLGNTCYLNSQLQCAYHVPYLRQLILEAKDGVKEVEVEVEVEVEEDEEEEEVQEGTNEEDLAPECADAEAATTETIDVESSTVDEEVGDAAGADVPKRTKTIIKKELKQEVIPRSDALLALQHTFASLTKATSSSGSGSTNVLCRALGINPYLQQDGQEFWKLFVPEVDYAKLSSLYSGFFEDYVREIIPEEESEELLTDDEEKKDDGDVMPTTISAEARERVRTEPFLDLSIPVAEGTGGSVQVTLRAMFTEPEILRVSEGNGWRPSAGADKVDAYKGSSLRRDGLPSLLQLHLKRFKYDWETGETSKINDCCSFPLELDLSEISELDEEATGDVGDAIYDLQSIVVHKGEYGSGHYYSYVRPDIRTNQWFRFDDEFVTPVAYSEVIADAYGGTRRARRKRRRSDSVESTSVPVKRRRGLLRRIFSLFGFLRRVPVIGSNPEGCGFGYGGRTSNAYMLQYARRSDIPRLYLENDE